MKNTRPLRWGKRALAALLCFGMAFSVPAGSALAEQTPTPTPAAQTAEPTPEPTASTPPGTVPEGALGVQEAAPSPTPAPTPSASPVPTASPAPEPTLSPTAATATPVPAAVPEQTPTPTPLPQGQTMLAETGEPSAYSGQQLIFVDLQWKTDPLDGVYALFTGGEGVLEAELTLEAVGRGLFTVTVPQGDYYRVAFFAAGSAAPLGGVWRLDGQPDGEQAEAVAFAAGELCAFYYDSGENPSYWGPAPGYDPAAQPAVNTLAADTVQTLALGDPGEPNPGDQVYFVDLHALEGDDADPIVTVEARFVQIPHGDMDEMLAEGQFLARTMYEVREGVYVAPFPAEIADKPAEAADNTGGYLYQEIAFDLTRRGGSKDKFNRHYSFRGKPAEEHEIPETWGTPGWFTYAPGTMDAYYYNSRVEDSYWNAHPSNADESLHGKMLYIDTRDFSEQEPGNQPFQNITDIFLSWDGMPTNLANYVPGQGVQLYDADAQNHPYATQTEGIYFFQMPADAEQLSENTVFTLTYTIASGSTHAGTHTFLFTFVPRSGRDAIQMDYLWEDVGEVWGVYKADPPEEGATRGVYYNNAVTAYGKVQVVFGKKRADGTYDWVTGPEACELEWSKGHVIDAVIGDKEWARGWLKMEPVNEKIDGYTTPANVWGISGIPAEYTHVMFRCSIDQNATTEDNSYYWFSPPLEIDQTYSYPCFFAYRYLNGTNNGNAANDNVVLGDPNYLDGQWGSAVEIYDLGNGSSDVPQGDNFVNEDNVYYGSTTFYDYYSHWEQSGRPITESTYTAPKSDIWGVQGILLNVAVSKYFETADGGNTNQTQPLYFGAGTAMGPETDPTSRGKWGQYLGASGDYKNYGTQYETPDLYNYTWHANTWKQYDGVRTGLLDNTLQNGEATMQGNLAPYFNEAFLRGDNDLDMTLGSVYKNVLFPFRRVEDASDPNNGYWQFDSSQETLRLTQGSDQTHYLKSLEGAEHVFVNGKNSYLPMNDPGDDDNNGNMTKINYMFGQRLDLEFTVPEGGQVNMAAPGEPEEMKDVTFEFSGDDDCWIFIDGQLVLDMGGIHDAVRGTINFKTKEWNLYRALDANNNNGTADGNGTFTLTGDEETVHTLTMFYMERGLYSSNLRITFNFPQQNLLKVTKEVDTSEVNQEVFGAVMDNLGNFEMFLDTQATSGQPLAVQNSAGYVATKSLTLYDPATADAQTNITEPASGEATLQTDHETQAKYLQVTQPNGWTAGQPPDKNLLTLTPPGGFVDLNGDDSSAADDDYVFLELELYNATDNNRGAELYIQLQDGRGHTCGGYVRTLGYLGEANLFLPNVRSLVRVDLDALLAAAPNFDRTNVTAVCLGLQNGSGTDGTGHYRIYAADFGTEWNRVLSTGFSVGDDQISDYGSLNEGGTQKGYQPADGAWYTRQTRSGGAVTESVASVVQNGSFSLGNGQTAVFTDKFRVGSYIRLSENVDPALFETTWSIRENGEPVSFNTLLPNRPDLVNVQNPDWGYAKGEYPLENQNGSQPDDGRTEKAEGFEKYLAEEKTQNFSFLYRSYLSPDNNENLPVDLEVVFHNKMRTGSFTIVKRLDTSMEVGEGADARYPVGTYTFDVYYTNIGGRGLEQYLPAQATVEGIGDRYVHQVITITTDAESGRGEYEMTGVPAGTRYIIRERPANGATLVGLEVTPETQTNATVQDVDKATDDYTNAYIQNSGVAAEEAPSFTFTNKNEPFIMKIEKVWQGGDPPTDIKEIKIQVQRRVAGSTDDWENVTKDYFGEEVGDGEAAAVTLTPDNGQWAATSTEMQVFPTQGTGQNAAILYEYRIVELGVGEGKLASYRVEYTELRDDAAAGDTPIIIYRATNIPTGLTLQKTWVDNSDLNGLRPTAVRVRLQRSTGYDPEQPNAAVTWETIGENGQQVAENAEDSYITLRAPEWMHSIARLPASVTVNGESKPYYYRLQEVQVQQADGSWAALGGKESDAYEPAYSLPVTLGEAAVLTVENALKTAAIRLAKQDAETGSPLPGATFKIERLTQTADGGWTVDVAWKAPEQQKTGADGTLTFSGLRPGRYRLTETDPPDGYAEPFAPVDVEVGADKLGQTVIVTVQNSKPQTFAFTKVAAQDHSAALPGAQFSLYPLVCTDTGHTHTGLLDPAAPGPCWGTGDQILPVTTTNNGKVEFTGLPAGVYRLVETKAPAGYARPTGQWQVTLAAGQDPKITAIGSAPAFATAADGSLLLPNRKPMQMPSSGGPGVPLAAALGTALMGAAVLLPAVQPHRPGRKNKRKDKQKGTRKKEEE